MIAERSVIFNIPVPKIPGYMNNQSELELAKTLLCISYLEEKIGRFYSLLSKISNNEEVRLAFNYLSMDSKVRRDSLRHIAKSLAPRVEEEALERCEDVVGSKLVEALKRYEGLILEIERGIAKKRDILNYIRWQTAYSGPEYLMMMNLTAFSFILREKKGINQLLKAMADGRKSRIEILERIAEIMESP